MPGAVWFISYRLFEGASVPAFLVASEKCHNEVLSKKKGFVSWKVLSQGNTWVDMVTWETMEDAINAEKDSSPPDPVAQTFYSFINFKSLKSQIYSIEKEH